MDSNSNPTTFGTVAEILASDSRPALSSLTPSLIRLYAILAPACLVVCATNGYDGSVLTGLQGVAAWNHEFGSPKGALLGITSAAYPLGAILSTPFSAMISDRFVRKWSILSGGSIMIIGVLIQYLSHSIGLFIGGRIVVGFGITMALAAAPVLISELAHPRHRVLFSSLCNTSFYLGALTAGWITFGSYRIPGSCTMAAATQTTPFVLAQFHEMKVALQLEKQVQDAGPKLFLKTPANRKRLLILVTLAVAGQWSGNGLVSYYLTRIFSSIGITGQREQTLLNGVISTVNYATALMAAGLSTKLGRRWMFVGGGVAMWLTFSSLTASIAVYNTKGTTASSQAALAFIFIYYAAFNLCLNPLLFLYPTEILPFRLRAMGLSILVFANKAASFLNQFVNPIGMKSLSWKYYLFYVGWLLVEIAVFYFLYPETKGYSLERMQEVFGEEIKDDGPEEKASIINEMTAVEHKE
ncbi:hypothetical protein COL154_008854 [Colletotrichum chrysophilum]|nr:hypothetical protein COL154_008854 [Colletotrichum chrysophilum]